MRIVFVGGDARSRIAAQRLKEEGQEVYTVSLSSSLPTIHKEDIFPLAQAVVLPTPVTRDGETVNGTDIPLSFFLAHPAVPLFGGGLPTAFLAQHPSAHDLLLDEGLAQTGAALTAQGAIAAALTATQRGFYRTRAAIFGFGRIASFLARGLSGLGVPVAIYARRREARARIALLGYEARDFRDVTKVEEALVFNTVPSAVFDKTVFSPEALVFDLGGGLKGYTAHPVTSLPGLPGKFAPVAAGEAMVEVLSAFLRKESEH